MWSLPESLTIRPSVSDGEWLSGQHINIVVQQASSSMRPLNIARRTTNKKGVKTSATSNMAYAQVPLGDAFMSFVSKYDTDAVGRECAQKDIFNSMRISGTQVNSDMRFESYSMREGCVRGWVVVRWCA